MKSIKQKNQKILQSRLKAGHTQTEAARAVHSALRTWQTWEHGEAAMHPGLLELYLIKTDQHPEFAVRRRKPKGGKAND